jgi:chromosome segregation ATPase
MPPKKAKNSAALAKAREVLSDKNILLASETATEDLLSELQAAHVQIRSLEVELAQKNAECNQLHLDLEIANQKLAKQEADLSFLKSKQEKTYHELCMQRQTAKQGQVKQARLQEQIGILQQAEAEASAQFLSGSKQSEQALALLTEANEGLQSELSRSMARWTSQVKKSHLKLEALKSKLKASHKDVSILRKRDARSKGAKERAIASVSAKILQKKSVHHLINKLFLQKRLVTLFVCLLELAAHKTTSIKSFLPFSSPQELPLLEQLAGLLLHAFFVKDTLQPKFSLVMK